MKTVGIILGIIGVVFVVLIAVQAIEGQPPHDDRLSIELQSLIKSAGTGIPTLIVINSSGEALTTINLPTPESGYIWSDPFTSASTWQVQRAGVTYTLAGDKLLQVFKANGTPQTNCLMCVTPRPRVPSR